MPVLQSRAEGFPGVSTDYKIRISETAFIASTGTFLSIAILSAAVRTALRWRNYRTLSADDYILIFSCACLIATAGVAWTIKDLVYLQIYVGVGWEKPAADFYPRMLIFEQRVVVCSALVWAAIYAVKVSFLLFFHRIVARIRVLMIQWWIVLAFVAVGACISVPLAVIICPHYGEDYMQYCPIPDQIAHEIVYLQTSVSIDVFTDVLLISIPVKMLWGLQMPLKRKLTLGALLTLSLFMIIIAIVRTTLAPLPNGVIDTSWLVFWQGMEAVVAVLMVSLTAIPGLFAIEQSRSTYKKQSSAKALFSGERVVKSPSIGGSHERNSKKNRGMYNEDSVLMTNFTNERETSLEYNKEAQEHRIYLPPSPNKPVMLSRSDSV